MTTSKVETITSPVDYIKRLLSVSFVVGGLIAYYLLGSQQAFARVGAVLAGLILGAGFFAWSDVGRRFLAFAKDSYKEMKRVTWPTSKEAFQMTIAVFVFVAVLALYMLLVDGGIGIVLSLLGLRGD